LASWAKRNQRHILLGNLLIWYFVLQKVSTPSPCILWLWVKNDLYYKSFFHNSPCEKITCRKFWFKIKQNWDTCTSKLKKKKLKFVSSNYYYRLITIKNTILLTYISSTFLSLFRYTVFQISERDVLYNIYMFLIGIYCTAGILILSGISIVEV
jgi:hypothetical protein